MNNTVKLRNGSEEYEPAVRVISLILLEMLSPASKDEPAEAIADLLAVYELREKARNSNHMIFSPVQTNILVGLNLMSESGDIHETTKNIVLSCIVGELLDMHWVDPIAQD